MSLLCGFQSAILFKNNRSSCANFSSSALVHYVFKTVNIYSLTAYDGDRMHTYCFQWKSLHKVSSHLILHTLLKVVNISVLRTVIYAIGKQEHKSAFRKDIKHECTEDGSILLCHNKCPAEPNLRRFYFRFIIYK